MITGLPGTGIGGMYYILLGLWMPFREMWVRRDGQSNPSRRSVIARQMLMTFGIIAGMALTGEFIGWLVAHWVTLQGASAEAAVPAGTMNFAVENYLHPTMFAWVFLVLIGVISSVHILRLAVRAIECARGMKAVPPTAPGDIIEDAR